MLAALYRARLESANTNQKHLDEKARWLLTVTMPVSAALVAYVSTGPSFVIAPALMLLGFVVASILAAVSLVPRDYEVGIKVPDEPEEYGALLNGGEERVIEFEHANIEELAKAVRVNDRSNDDKARWLHRAMWAAVLTPIVAALSFLYFGISLFGFTLSSICPFAT